MTDAIISRIDELLQAHGRVILSVDGRCGAGKTLVAEKLGKRLECNIIHLDTFFLRPSQRTPERLAEPGGNVDYERFGAEVLLPLGMGLEVKYRPYSCRSGDFEAEITLPPKDITIIEGSYSCHPRFWQASCLHVFLDVAPEEQLRRIARREGQAAAEQFREIWIPMEEKYFSAFKIREKCEMYFDTTDI